MKHLKKIKVRSLVDVIPLREKSIYHKHIFVNNGNHDNENLTKNWSETKTYKQPKKMYMLKTIFTRLIYFVRDLQLIMKNVHRQLL